MALYRLTNTDAVIREIDQAVIPADPNNLDYAAFTAWVTAGGVPDPVPVPPINQSAQLAAIQAARVSRLAAKGDTLAALAMQAGMTPPKGT